MGEQQKISLSHYSLNNIIMKLLHSKIKIPACSKDTIAKSDDVFTGWIDSDFERWGTDVKSPQTEETDLAVLEMDKNGTFKETFDSVSKDTDSMCLTQAQIIAFVNEHKDKLRTEGYGTFFLFKVNDEVFVASVDLDSDERPDAFVGRFSDDYVWYAEYRHRVVVPSNGVSQSLIPGDSDSLRLRFFEKVSKIDNATGCWSWKGAIDAHGYGSFVVEGLTQKAHRVSYEMAKGEIAEGLVIDHICKNNACVNPEHLRAISRIENVMIGDGPTAINARKTHCNKGHELKGKNLKVYKGKRYCQKCKIEWQLALKNSDAAERPFETLTLEAAIARVKQEGFVLYKPI